MPAGPPATDTDPPGRLARVCVFCGSSPGRDPAFVAAAVDARKARLHDLADVDVVLPGGLGTLEAHEPRVEPKWIEP